MNCKRKGNRNEHKSIKLLEAAGYACTRAAASLGTFDIVAISETDIILCQVKSRDWPGSVEMEGIRLFKAPANCRKLIHRWRDRVSLPDVREISSMGPHSVERGNDRGFDAHDLSFNQRRGHIEGHYRWW